MTPNEVVTVNLSKLKPDNKNARKHSSRNVDEIVRSLEKFGQHRPFVVQRDTEKILVGNGMYEAMKKLGIKEGLVLYVDDDDETAARRAIADNRTAELAEWDFDVLKDIVQELGPEPDVPGWSDKELEELLNAGSTPTEIIEDEAPPVPEVPRSKTGDLWLLGQHRLLCGDCTLSDNVSRLMGGQKAILCLTDPPYGINIVSHSSATDGGGGQTKFKGKVGGGKIVEAKEYDAIIGDDTTNTARAAYMLCIQHSNNQIIFGGNYFTDFLPPSPCWIIWDKENTGNFADVEIAWASFGKAAKLYRWLWNGMSRKGDHKTEGATRVHPTQKPVGLMGAILKDFTNEDDAVLDLFGGSGSTLIACEQLNRKCYTMELDPKYCDVIIKRWQEFTGQKAIHADTGENFD